MSLTRRAARVGVQQEGIIMTTNTGRLPYRFAAGIAIVTALFQMWINLAVGIVGNEDNPVNLSFFGVVATALACSFTAGFRAAGMARAMLAVAATQALLAMVIATAPSTALEHSGARPVIVLSSAFTLLWLLSAALFRRSARAAG